MSILLAYFAWMVMDSFVLNYIKVKPLQDGLKWKTLLFPNVIMWSDNDFCFEWESIHT